MNPKNKECPYCGEYFNSLEFASHRAACRRKNSREIVIDLPQGNGKENKMPVPDIGEWIDARKYPLHELQDERYCEPNPYTSGDKYEQLILCFRFEWEKETHMLLGKYYPKEELFFDSTGLFRMRRNEDHERGTWDLFGPDENNKLMKKHGNAVITNYLLVPDIDLELP